MSRRGVLAASVALLLAAPLLPSAAADTTVTVAKKTLHFDTLVGPDNATHCDVVADLYTPSTASRSTPAPAILTTNGFGGSKDDQAAIGQTFGQRGDVVLSYSGLGFGGSGCKIELDDRAWDGKAGRQLVSFLGGSKAATDGTKIDYVQKDAVSHDGVARRDDPRVGMVGGSYGGQIQYAIAAIDPRLDTIIRSSRSRTRSSASPVPFSSPRGSTTTASSTRATPVPCSACACPRCTRTTVRSERRFGVFRM